MSKMEGPLKDLWYRKASELVEMWPRELIRALQLGPYTIQQLL